MFTLCKVILIRVGLMDGDTNLKKYNLKKKKNTVEVTKGVRS